MSNANLYNPMNGGGAPKQKTDPWSSAGMSSHHDSFSVASGNASAYTAASAPPANAYPQLQHQQNPYGSNPFGVPPTQQYQQPTIPFGEQRINPYSYGAPHAHTETNSMSNAIVVSNNQSNPYATNFQPNPYTISAAPYENQQLVASSQQSPPWGMQTAPLSASVNPFDPFAKSPEPAPVPQMQAMELYQPPQIDSYNFQQAQQQQNQLEPYQSPPADPAPVPAPITTEGDFVNAPSNGHRESEVKEVPDALEPPKGTTYPPQIQYGQKDAARELEPELSEGRSPRNPYATELARQAPPGSSPLPKAELVLKRGFVLARISFRAIIMKKWKQTFWVQYGPHTMLWFRSQADFDDWLNNPYLMQAERNFLIKLAVNFVHDLYKPSVRGYQVTQCRTKGYGNKIVRQFKLERWMDYGPTIAAAFGSYNPAEVDCLREVIVQCMRNTPLNGGIRATGAVRQRAQEDDYDEGEPVIFCLW